MFEFLRRWRRKPAPGGAFDRSRSPDPEPAPPAAPALPDQPDAPLEAWASAMGLSPGALGLPPRALTDEERRTAGLVLFHFDRNRPGPASFPSLALRILDLVRDPDVEVAELARTVETDPALSAGVLVLANSVVYRGVAEVRTVKEAVARLGLSEVARLSSALATRSLYRADLRAEFEIFGPVWNRLFYHALTVARAASELARLRKLGDPDQAFAAGLLHDVGKSIAMRSFATLVLEGQVAGYDGPSIDRILHQVHVEVGAAVHEEWKLPAHLRRVAAEHHAAAVAPGPDATGVHLVRLVSALRLVRLEPELHRAGPAEVVDSARALGLGPARVQALAGAIAETEEWVRMVFGDETGGPAAAR